MSNIYSSAYLYRFLRLVAKQQRVPSSTLQAWKASVRALLPAENECADLRDFDLDAAVTAYVDRQLLQFTTVLPWQIHQHRSAFESMLSDFLLFSAHPKQYLAALTALHADRAVGTDFSSAMPSAVGYSEREVEHVTTFDDILRSLPRPRRVKVISPLKAANDA